MIVTIAICTLNRAESLRLTLASLAAMRMPPGIEWEIVVVDNGSTDHTSRMLREHGGVIHVYEPQRGISNARNRAVEVARGDYIIWTDDDVIVDPNWLTAYLEAFRRWPDAAVFGGKIVPKYEGTPPKWIAEAEGMLSGTYAERDFGNIPLPLPVAQTDGLPFSANLAVRTKEQRSVRFNPELGASPSHRRTAEETDVIEAIFAAGATGYWIPDAMVYHRIGRDRQTTHYIANWFARLGETAAFRSGVSPDPARVFGAPRWLWRRLAAEWCRYRLCRWVSPAQTWMIHLRNYAIARGEIRHWRHFTAAPAQTASRPPETAKVAV